MKKIIWLIGILVFSMVTILIARQIDVPIVLNFIDAGIDLQTVDVDITINDQDSTLTAGTKSFDENSIDSTDYKVALDTFLTVNTLDDRVTVNAKVTFGSGIIQRKSWIYEPKGIGNITGGGTLQQYVYDTTNDLFLSGVDITIRELTGFTDRYQTLSGGYRNISVDSGDTVIRSFSKPGYSFDIGQDTLVMTAWSVVDTVLAASGLSATLSYVYFDLSDIGADSLTTGVTATFTFSSDAMVEDTCNNRIVASLEEFVRKPDANGRVGTWLLRSKCLTSGVYSLTVKSGRKIYGPVDFNVPDAETYKVTFQ